MSATAACRQSRRITKPVVRALPTRSAASVQSYRNGADDAQPRLEGNVPNPLAEAYYRQRAGAGLIITEATQVSPQGVGYIRTPGIHSPEQIAGWRKITARRARAGGKIFLQLWHVGRISHPDFHDGALPVAPSAIAPDGEVFTAQGPKKMVTPRALDASEIPGIVEQFRKGAENAKAAGFDGVEIHGANGYLLDQFTRDGTNLRTDRMAAARSRTACVCRWTSQGPSSMCGARSVSDTASRRPAPTTRCRIPIRARRFRISRSA